MNSLTDLTVFLCYAVEDRIVAHELAEFLRRGAAVDVIEGEGEIAAGESLTAKVERGLQADVVVVILSPHVVAASWDRKKWSLSGTVRRK